jgi:hypothetical protein
MSDRFAMTRHVRFSPDIDQIAESLAAGLTPSAR